MLTELARVAARYSHSMSEANVQIIRRLVEAFNRDDVEGVLETFAQSCELHEPREMPDTPAGGYRGHDGIREWMANLKTGAIQFESRGFQAQGDVVLAEWAGTGVGHASQAPFQWTTAVVFHLREGKVARAQAFLSTDEALETAGFTG